MMLTTERQLATILEHADELARQVDGHLDAPVEGCPGWDVATLLDHLISVHWFWAYDVENRMVVHYEGDRPSSPPRDGLISVFVEGARRLVDVLRSTDPSERVWTWAPTNQTASFVARHQVQEMVVHHVDGARAVGHAVTISPDVGADCVDEFLSYSLSSLDDPKEPPPPPLGSPFALHASDSDARWTVFDGETSGVVRFTREIVGHPPTLIAPAGDLLLWLYSRVELDTSDIDDGLVARLRAFTYTD
jgi:uncharacterized protein (TIGR03083 family)